MTSERGKGKPGPNSKKFHIWGSDQTKLRAYREQEREGNESLNDPTRVRRSSQDEAHKAKLEERTRESLRDRLGPMKPIKASNIIEDELEEEGEMAA